MSSQLFYIPVEQTEVLASGLWGTVFRVKNEKIVVKVAKDGGKGLFESERKCLERLGGSGVIARYLGVAQVGRSEDGKSGLLFEYYPLGTLKDFLGQPVSIEVRSSRKQQLQWTSQVVDALIKIHTLDVIHGDIGIHNILVADNYNLKLTDFGGSSIDGAEMQVECSPRYHRPHSWRFPITGVDCPTETWRIPTRKIDTFALGTVLYEIFTAAQLYKDENYDQIRRHATRREYPDLNVIELPEVRGVITKCWSEQYDDAQQIMKELAPIWEEVNPRKQYN
ncbi:hypothetical protein JX265_001793 [Neoarthrinium moseri]|uniref:Protein kinase domain-containing protein n=1 Tax=Neoarthrinium moseri TaxID=1658444 RepID=A0A9Q0AU59_9PEZI|nr:uncharacterized protein JN550_005372 [Neoarthrinium moseri]KAI1842359.1 hypothetical protein JX266_011400 [Neoarthrinium moseri]KAI1870444.1 hypothetical protein JN550_005372 [Neoarthrinium moseri]KAI1880172.1 hypothetical protein JX265_001793 [Neoarthrinium moseri]